MRKNWRLFTEIFKRDFTREEIIILIPPDSESFSTANIYDYPISILSTFMIDICCIKILSTCWLLSAIDQKYIHTCV